MPNFTDLPAPRRTHRLSIVAVGNPIHPPTMQCENAGCKQDDIEEIAECPVCGRWMCEECFEGRAMPREIDYSTLPTRPYCDDCSKLTTDERQAVMALREQLSH